MRGGELATPNALQVGGKPLLKTISGRLANMAAAGQAPRWVGWAAGAVILALIVGTWSLTESVHVRFWTALAGLTMLFAMPIVMAPDRYKKYALVLPASVILFGLALVPVAAVLVLSLTDSGLGFLRGQFQVIGLDNYVKLLTEDSDARNAMVRTIMYVFFTVTAETVLALAIALLLNQKSKASQFSTTVLLIPMMATPIVIGLIWRTMFAYDDGLINRMLTKLGLEGIPWLTATAVPFLGTLAGKKFSMFGFSHGFLSAQIVDIWQWTPFLILIFLAGLKTVPPELYEAGQIDGATPWQLFWHITVPQVMPVIAVGVAIRVVDAFKAFEQIWALFGNTGPYRTLAVDIFSRSIEVGRFGEASAESVLLLLVSMVISFGVLAWSRREARS